MMHTVQHRSPSKPSTPKQLQQRDVHVPMRGAGTGGETGIRSLLTLWRLLSIASCCILIVLSVISAGFARDYTVLSQDKGIRVSGRTRRSQLEGQGVEEAHQITEDAGMRRQRARPRIHQGIAKALDRGTQAQTWPRNGKGVFKQQPERHQPPSEPLQPSDFVVAIASQYSNQGMLTAGRAARKEMITYVATNYEPSQNRSYPKEPNEKWGFFPDDRMVRSFYKGDTRAAVVPFMAYKELGDTFKWLFYGDDDTVFFIDAAIRMAQGLDHNMPYFISDNLWYSEHWVGALHPHVDAIRCLPCGFDESSISTIMKMAVGCPCTPQVVCTLDDGYLQVISNESCGVPRTPVRTYAVHGGAGVLISVGLFRNVNYHSYVRAVRRSWNSGGDAFFTTALWQAGFVATDPGPKWHSEYPEMTRFDPRGLKIFHPDEDILPKSAYVLANMLRVAAGTCHSGSRCKLEYNSFVSLHLRARRMGGSKFVAAAIIRAFSRFCATHLRPSTGNVPLHDSASAHELALADLIDARLQAAVEGVKQLGGLFQAPAEDGNEDKNMLEIPSHVMVERMQAATVSALARHVLTLAIKDAVASEEALLAAAKRKLKQIETAETAAEEAQHVGGASGEVAAQQQQAEI